MFKLQSFVLALATIATSVTAHAVVTTPTPRQLGAANIAACGAAVNKVLASDKTGPIENAVKKIDSAYNATACHLYFCRGGQFEDNVSNTRVYAAGTVVPFHIDLVAHHTGYANASIVNLATQKTIGQPVYVWPVYANSSLGPADWPKNETDFEITIPNLGTQCATSGACAIQWFWYATENSQTYESCVDFTQ